MTGVRTEHDDLAKFQVKWKRVRDVVAGQDAVHMAGVEYLPRLKDQSIEDYKAYVMRTPFYNASWRTVAGLVGMIFRKEPKVEVPTSVEEYLKDVDMSNTPFSMFAQEVTEETMEVGRIGVLVDFPPLFDADNKPITLAVANRLGLRPTMQMYKAECIINWKFKLINNKFTLYMVVLKEDFCIPKNEFEDTHEDRYRVLDLTPDANFYRIRVFRIDEKGQDELVSEVMPIMNGGPLDYIPFVFMSPDGIEAELDEPPLLDLIDLNLSHYRTTADYEHGCHFTGLPTPWIAGYSPVPPEVGKEPEKLYIGSQSAWTFSDPNTRVGFLEFTGQGLTALKENLDRKEQQMAIIGARLLAAEKKQAETATTSAIHRTGENSILSQISISVSLGLEQALKWFAAWAGASSETIKCQLNKNFLPVTIDAQTLLAYMQTWQAGGFSEQEFFDLLQSGDLIDPEVTFEDHQSQIEVNPAMASPLVRIGQRPGQVNPQMPGNAQ